jgi:hypothetical protein
MNINNELVLQLDINFNGIKIYQNTINEIFAYGIEEYNKLLLPFFLTLDDLKIPKEEQNKYNMFDLIMLEEELFYILVNSIRYFCKTDNIKTTKTKSGIGLNIDGGILNRDNYEEFCNIILKIHSKERLKEDILPENPRQKEIELKLREARARCKPKSDIQLCDIINIVKYGGKYHISTEEIKKMTLWDLSMAYYAKVGVSNWEDSLSIALVSGDKENKLDNLHWLKQLKVDK